VGTELRYARAGDESGTRVVIAYLVYAQRAVASAWFEELATPQQPHPGVSDAFVNQQKCSGTSHTYLAFLRVTEHW
jgi:hypothetical protein